MAIVSADLTGIGWPTVLSAAEIGVTVLGWPPIAYTVTGPVGVCGALGVWPTVPPTVGMAAAITATAATLAAALRAWRRRRRRMPAHSDFCTTGPNGGSCARALSSSLCSDVSSMLWIPCLTVITEHEAGAARLGHDVAQHGPEFVQGPGALALHVARWSSPAWPRPARRSGPPSTAAPPRRGSWAGGWPAR